MSKPHATFDADEFLKTSPNKPGVYWMLNDDSKVLYVGKAKKLKKRLASYFQKNIPNSKTRALMSQVKQIEITITHSENEALILENNLIKKHHPKYNVLFRDDKSYPYIFLSHHDFPRLCLYRGAKSAEGEYYGPYPNTSAARESLNLIQKLFRIRQCSDSFYKNRSRPCLQYQIKRCTAPCVSFIDKKSYANDVKLVKLFLQGKNQQVTAELVERMEECSENLDYEKAAFYRDQIASIRKILEKQYVTSKTKDIDVVAIIEKEKSICIQFLFFRAGQLLGNKTFFPKNPQDLPLGVILQNFLSQYYLSPIHQQNLPKKIVGSEKMEDASLLASVLQEQCQRHVDIVHGVRGESKKWIDMAIINGQQNLSQRLQETTTLEKQLLQLQQFLRLDGIPQRIECFDVSHSSGEATVASCVVFDENGPLKQDYRRFNIKDIEAGDDYAAMYQALTRRYTRLKSKEKKIPDLILIDGGKGQLTQGMKVLEELQLDEAFLLAIAKGEGRKAGLERFFVPGSEAPLTLQCDSPALHLLQQIRDEAHRFAITGHRARRDKKRRASSLEDIEGIGAKRRRLLLNQFGGLQGLKEASIDDLVKTPGISKHLAKKIHHALHAD